MKKEETLLYAVLAIGAMILRWIAIVRLYAMLRLDSMPILSFWQIVGFLTLYGMIKYNALRIKEEYIEHWTKSASLSFIVFTLMNLILSIISWVTMS